MPPPRLVPTWMMALTTPPSPPMVALPVKVLSVTVAVADPAFVMAPPAALPPPPPPWASFARKVLWLTVRRLELFRMAPPLAALPPLMPIAWFWRSRLSLTVSVPPERLAMAPPWGAPPVSPGALLFDRTSLARVRPVLAFPIAPPLLPPRTLPLLIVNPAIVTVTPPLMAKIRLAWLPQTAS